MVTVYIGMGEWSASVYIGMGEWSACAWGWGSLVFAVQHIFIASLSPLHYVPLLF